MKIAGLPIKGVAQEVIIIDHLAGEIRSYQVFELDLGTRSDVPLLKGPVLSVPMPAPASAPLGMEAEES